MKQMFVYVASKQSHSQYIQVMVVRVLILHIFKELSYWTMHASSLNRVPTQIHLASTIFSQTILHPLLMKTTYTPASNLKCIKFHSSLSLSIREFDQDSTMINYVKRRVITQVYHPTIIFYSIENQFHWEVIGKESPYSINHKDWPTWFPKM